MTEVDGPIAGETIDYIVIVAYFIGVLGFGSLFGLTVLPAAVPRWTIMVMAPSAFFLLGIFIWVVKTIQLREEAARGS